MQPNETDRQQFLELVEAHQGILHRICLVYANQPADRQDLFQEMVLQLWRSFGSFRAQASSTTWMYRVAVNTCLGWLRRGLRRSRMLERAREEQRFALAVMEPDPATAAAENVQQLYACLARLAPVDRLLASLYLEEIATAEIAAVLGISEGNVRVKLHRIKNQLRGMGSARLKPREADLPLRHPFSRRRGLPQPRHGVCGA